MPTYEFQCINCDTYVAITQSIHEPIPTSQCERCGYTMVRVYDAPAIQFKGGGFYSTSSQG